MLPLVVGVTLAAKGVQARAFEYASPRDRDVIVAFGRAIFEKDRPVFGSTRVRQDILLFWRNPDNSSILGDTPPFYPSEKRSFPKGVWHDLISRNCVPNSDKTKPILYTGRTFPESFEITHARDDLFDLAHIFNSRLQDFAGWIKPYAPGYSKDGRTAMISAWYGWGRHAQIMTAVLELKDDRWTVKWKQALHFV